MDLEQVQRLAQAFAQGVAFARGFTEMAQDAKDGEEEGHWVTIGGERGADGEKHGGRPVFISGSGTIKKGLSKSAQGKTLGQVFGKGGEFSSEGKKSKGESSEGKKHLWGKQRDAAEWNQVHEINLKNKKENAEIRRKADKLMGVNEKDRRDATSRAREFRQETKQIVANDLEPSVAKLKKALDANVPARVHDDLVDMHRLADQIGIMANKLCSLNSRYAENSKEPSAFVVSSHGQNAKGTAERVAKLARQSAALAHEFGKPKDERFSYGDTQVASEIRDNLSELRGLHQDLLDHIRRIQEPEKREEPQEDPLYAARGKVINGPARANATAKTTRATPATPSANLSADDKKALKQIKDLVPEIGPVFHQAKSDLEFYSPSEKKGILKEVRFSDAHVTENIKYLNELEGYVKREKEVRALAKGLNAAIRAGKLTPEDRNIYVRNLEYGFNELTKGIQRGAQAMYDYAERANRGGYVSKIDDQWIRGAVRQARGGLIHITWTANKLKELK